jgi:CubicO group peptidase (beta-lactamase class C family)
MTNALLANEGKTSLADDVKKYLPKVPDFGEAIVSWL